MSLPQTCDNCGERARLCECGDFRPADTLFDDPEEEGYDDEHG